MAALRQKKAHEDELLRLSGTRATLETQVNAIESANLNAETMLAMKKGAEALKGIHSNLYVLFCFTFLHPAHAPRYQGSGMTPGVNPFAISGKHANAVI
jgi:hypothetical protein